MEKDSHGVLKFFVQYLLSPVIVVVIGLMFNSHLEKKRQEIQQLQIAQSMLSTLFSEDEFKVLATKRIMDEVLESERLKQEIGQIVEDYLKSKVNQSIQSGDIGSAQKVLDAAKSIGGDAGASIVDEIQKNPENMATINKYDQATRSEKIGFESLIKGNFKSAMDNFKKSSETYPDLHSVSEIYSLLRRNENQFDDTDAQKTIYKTIVEKYSWKVPAETINALKSRY